LNTNTSVLPLYELSNALVVVGKSNELVPPVMKAFPIASFTIPKPSSIPSPPTTVE